jgi:hypothetical protein
MVPVMSELSGINDLCMSRVPEWVTPLVSEPRGCMGRVFGWEYNHTDSRSLLRAK